MCLGCRKWVVVALLIFVSGAVRAEQTPVLRICSDPNNLPFSNDKQEGFENKIAELVARELGMKIEYSWRAQRRGFFRETLKENQCDLVMGMPAHFERALATNPYYRSSYVFVSRKDRGLDVSSFDDPRLKELKVGVQLVGDDGMNTPPAHALARRGIVQNVVGFTLYGDYAQPNPPARIVEAVAKGDIDVAVVWGPTAGYFAKKQNIPMTVTPVAEKVDASLPFSFEISMGVRKQDTELKKKLDDIIDRKRQEIDQILDEYGIPRSGQ